jgi:hypothetical protein
MPAQQIVFLRFAERAPVLRHVGLLLTAIKFAPWPTALPYHALRAWERRTRNPLSNTAKRLTNG